MDQVEEVKRKIDVVDLISSYLTVKKAGRNYKACCPFHKEKTASFMVSPEKQIWYCFGCNQGGDIFSFIEKIEGLDFVGALNMLADRAGVILDRKDFSQRGKKDVLFNIIDLSTKFFSYMLNDHPIGREAKKYLVEKRSLKESTLKQFALGYAPDGGDLLKKFLLKKGFSEKDIFSAGLLVEKGKTTVDKFRERIIFPIRNVSGKTVAFGGRIFKEPKNSNFVPPKYLNSPQTDIYDKSSILYGLDLAKDAIREKDLAIVVEGNIDVISSHQVGIKNVVASSGTALTEKQVEILSRYTNNIAFCFDSDEAGYIATKRAMEMTHFSDINIKVIVINEGKDPDELIKRNTSVWLDAVENPVPIISFYYGKILKDNKMGKSSEEKKKITKEMLPIIGIIGNDIEKAHWIKTLSNDLGIAEKYLIEALKKIEIPKSRSGNIEGKINEENDGTLKIKISKELLLLFALIIYSENRELFFREIKEDDLLEDFSKKLYKKIFIWHNNEKNSKAKIDLDYIKKDFDIGEKNNIDVFFFLASTFFEELSQKDIDEDVKKLIEVVIKSKKEKRKKEIEKEISSLNREKNKEEIKILLRELQSLI